MDTAFCLQLARLRLLVGYLGEQQQYHWWSSAFLTSSSLAFLRPIFSKTAVMAQYQGVKAAASRVHDAHLGLGKVYHLFRLPERLEHTLYQHMQDVAFVDSLAVPLHEPDQAMTFLATCAEAHPEPYSLAAEGPVLMGPVAALVHGYGNTIGQLAQHYGAAFASNTQVYPYYGAQT